MMRRSPGLTLAVLLLAGCSFIPDYQQPSPTVVEHWRDASPQGDAVPLPDWHKVFPDPELQRLIELARVHNHDLQVAVLRIDEARALYGISTADQWPSGGIDGSVQRQKISAADSPTGKAVIREQGQFRLGITAFELDLWGRVRALKTEAGQRLVAREEDALSVGISLVGEVATAYYEHRAYLELHRQNRQLLERAGESKRLIGRRQELGLASELELRQADTLALTLEAEMADAARQQGLALNRLELLVGTTLDPARLSSGEWSEGPQLPEIAPGLPSELLVRRPDIRAAEARLKAFNANIGAARAAFLPSISLTGFFGVSSPQLSELFSGEAKGWSFTPAVTLPLFDIGRRFTQLELSKVQRDIAVVEYQRSIQQAFREVADALASNEPLNRQLNAQQRLVLNESRRVELAQLLHQDGLNSYLEVLDAQRGLSTAQQALIRTRLLQVSNRIALYKSLGGGWS
ncbi:efflux transporter outer membrane subunit [Pseudomonas sp. MWU12-2345]|uniref:efflux transporter outer membrane subunit n=1 Tax=Pseudomonas sp. MWU12-2345 TaxID=2928689 RepID=UPI00200C2596|nr:efflux transporter outer membrane subunit [Pseudomonas sp. MWU12-2345]